MAIALRVLDEDAATITLGWTPVVGAIGYRFTRSAAPIVAVPSGGTRRVYSHTYDPLRSSARFARDSDWYRVDPLFAPEEAVFAYPSDAIFPREKVV